MISMIAAISVTGVIGLRGNATLLWDSAIDKDIFKQNTEGQVVVMGNNTLKSIGKPLKNRTNVVLSKTEEPGVRNNVHYYNSIGEIIEKYATFVVIGGEAIYNLFLPVADEILLSTISLDFEEDEDFAYFPVDEMEKSFFMIHESAVLEDTDKKSNIPINLIVTRWQRSIPNIH